MTKTMKNYLVIWEPTSYPTPVDTMKVIDAFATEGGIRHARKLGFANRKDYAAAHGVGYCMVVESGRGERFLAN